MKNNIFKTALLTFLIFIGVGTVGAVAFFINYDSSAHTSELAFIESSSDSNIIGSVVPASCASVPPGAHFAGDSCPLVTGVCGGSAYNCSAGSSVANADLSDRWTWTCAGAYGGGSPSCTVMKPVNGVCAINHNACAAGASSGAVTFPDRWEWQCLGMYGGSNAPGTCSEWRPPYISITASPSLVGPTLSTNISWTVDNATSCTGSGGVGWAGAKSPTSGSETIFPSSTPIIYALNCTGIGGSGGNSTTVLMPSGYISATSCTIVPESPSCSSTVNWSADNFLSAPAVSQTGLVFSSAVSGPVIRQVNPSDNSFTLKDTGSLFTTSGTASALCQSGSVWDTGLCRTLPVITLSANPNLIRSGATAPISVQVQSLYALDCVLNDGGTTQTFTHTPPATTQNYLRTTRSLSSAQTVTVQCTSPTYPLVTGTGSTRVSVIPTIQEI